MKKSSCKVPVIFVGFEQNLNVLNKFSKKSQIPNLIKIRPVGAELFCADGQTAQSHLNVTYLDGADRMLVQINI